MESPIKRQEYQSLRGIFIKGKEYVMENLKKLVTDLMKIKSVSGTQEVYTCIQYCIQAFQDYPVHIEVLDDKKNAPVLYLANKKTMTPDVLVLGHLDVVPGKEEQFMPIEKDGRLYGRGGLDMKAFASVALTNLKKVIEENLNLTFSILLTTDEEVGGEGIELWCEKYPEFCPKIVLDNDVGGDIYKIVDKCKAPVFVKLKASGDSVHGSTPWEGTDAIERLIQTIVKLRKKYPYYAQDVMIPEDTWINTLHVGKISGGTASNIVSAEAEALLDFRLVETYSIDKLKKDIEESLSCGVYYEIVSSGTPVVMDSQNMFIQEYKNLAEQELKGKIEFEQIGGATDSKIFAQKGAVVIYHSGTGEGMHGDNEYVVLESVEKLADIQMKFLRQLSSLH